MTSSTATELRTRLAEMDAEIIQQHEILKKLYESRMILQTQLDSLVYPVLTLPVEITSEIFIHCLPVGNAKVMLAHAPLLLLKICRRWREIALTTPRLWATLDVNVVSLRNGLCPESSPSCAEWISLATGWLSRARHNPLSVALRHPPEEDHGRDIFQPDFDFIRRISHQLESLEVYGLAEGDELYDSPDFTLGSFPMLKRLFVGPAVPGNDLETESLAFFADAPNLRELVISGYSSTLVSDISLPWQQLTMFSGYNLALDDFLDILRSAPDLERCNISLRFDGPSQPMTHPRLQYLAIFLDSDGHIWPSYEILKFVTLPALNTLDVSQLIGLPHDELETFLSRSSPPLRQFALAPECEDDFTFWDTSFRLIPDVEELRLHCRESIFQEGFLKAFSRSENRLLPNLRHFTIRLPSSRHRDVGAALEERRKHEDKLSTAMMLLAPEDAVLPSLNIQFI